MSSAHTAKIFFRSRSAGERVKVKHGQKATKVRALMKREREKEREMTPLRFYAVGASVEITQIESRHLINPYAN